MASRPSSSPFTWAKNADSNDVTRPTNKEADGYLPGEVRSNDEFNWLIQRIADWISYFDDNFGGSTGAVDFFNGIQYSDNGNIDLTEVSDDTDLWKADFSHDSGGSSRTQLAFDIFEAIEQVATSSLKGSVGTSNLVRFHQLLETDGSFNDSDADGGAILQTLVQNLSDGINVQDENFSDYNGGFHLGFLRAHKTDAIGTDRLPVKAGNDANDLTAEAMADALNTPKVVASVEDLDTSDPAIFYTGGVQSGTGAITKNAAGDYEISVPIDNATSVVNGYVQITGDEGSGYTRYDSRVYQINSNTFGVKIIGGSGLTDPATGRAFVTFYYDGN